MASTNIWNSFKLMDPENSPIAMDTSREGSVSGSSFTGSYSGSGSNSTMSTTGTDEQGNEMLLALERKSVKPYKTKDEYLYAMMEDLAEWFNVLYNMNITVDSFFEEMETGVLLCEHANNVQDVIRASFGKDTPKPSNPRATPIYMADYVVTYKKNVKPGTFLSRDNISNFLTWCVRLGIPDNLRFETDDLVLRKHERNVVLCLLEVARRGAKYGMLAPVLIQLEEEIDAEIAGKQAPTEPVAVIIQRKTCDLMSLDEMVRDMVSACTCPSQFPMMKVSDGKYRIGDSQTLIFVRILRNHVMVRIGGGWDTLENYLDRHDPCRCHTRGHKHRGTSPHTVQMKRRVSAASTDNQLTGLEIKSSHHKNHTIEEVEDEDISRTPTNQSLVKQANRVLREKKSKPPASPRKSSLGVVTPARNSPHSSPRKAKRSLPNIPGNQPKRNTSPTGTRSETPTPSRGVASSVSKTGSFSKVPVHTPRSRSALERRHSDATNHKQYWQWGSDEDLTEHKVSKKKPDNKRSSSIARTMDFSEARNQNSDSSHSVSGLSSQITNEINQLISPEEDVLVISRDDTGRHKIGITEEEQQGSYTAQNINTNLNSGFQKTFTANKFQLTADKILPSKPKNMTRTASQSSEQSGESNGAQYERYKTQYSGESDSYSESSGTNGSTSTRSASVTTGQVTRTWSQESTQSIDASQFDTRGFDATYAALCNEETNKNIDSSKFGFTVDDYPEAPPEDTELNRQMEELFEEYRRVERGLFKKQKSADDLLAPTEKQTAYKPKSKQDFSKVQSKLKEYFTNSPKKTPSPATPRHNTPPRMRSITPNPTTSNRSTPARRTLPRAPSPGISSNPNSSTSSHSAFTAVSKNVNPIKAAQPSSWTSAWRQNKPDLNKTCDTTTGKTPNLGGSLKTPRTSRPSTPTGKPSIKASPQITMNNQKPPPKSFRPASAPLRRKPEQNTSTKCTDDVEESSGFMVQSTGAWAVKTQSKAQSKSVPHTPAKRAVTPQKSGSHTDMVNKAFASSALRSKSTLCLTPEGRADETALKSKDDMDKTLTKQASFEKEVIQSKPRKDTRNQLKSKTKIPMPVRCKSADPYSQHLKRCDSGVDINNVSPTDTTLQGDEEADHPWNQTEGVALSPQALSEYSAQCSPFDEKNNEFF